MKKLLVIAAAITTAVVVRRKLQESRDRKSAWSKATDTVS
ncbi:DLW-39 family protein [Specibacter cremeus]|nr:DLW-39 family protein [Specibacter cremeus]